MPQPQTENASPKEQPAQYYQQKKLNPILFFIEFMKTKKQKEIVRVFEEDARRLMHLFEPAINTLYSIITCEPHYFVSQLMVLFPYFVLMMKIPDNLFLQAGSTILYFLAIHILANVKSVQQQFSQWLRKPSPELAYMMEQWLCGMMCKYRPPVDYRKSSREFSPIIALRQLIVVNTMCVALQFVSLRVCLIICYICANVLVIVFHLFGARLLKSVLMQGDPVSLLADDNDSLDDITITEDQ